MAAVWASLETPLISAAPISSSSGMYSTAPGASLATWMKNVSGASRRGGRERRWSARSRHDSIGREVRRQRTIFTERGPLDDGDGRGLADLGVGVGQCGEQQVGRPVEPRPPGHGQPHEFLPPPGWDRRPGVLQPSQHSRVAAAAPRQRRDGGLDPGVGRLRRRGGGFGDQQLQQRVAGGVAEKGRQIFLIDRLATLVVDRRRELFEVFRGRPGRAGGGESDLRTPTPQRCRQTAVGLRRFVDRRL